jgi:dienelactone hydrolase
MSCAACFSGASATGTPKGSTSTLHGEQTYIALPPPSSSTTSSPSRTIILYTDAFGLRLPNNLLLADALAARTQARVLVPDVIPGGGMAPGVLELMDVVTDKGAGVFRRGASLGRAMGEVLPFYWRAAPGKDVCRVRCGAFARAVRAGIEGEGKLGVVGYCWGGSQGLWVAAQGRDEGSAEGKDMDKDMDMDMDMDKGKGGGKGLVDALFVAHPARFTTQQLVDAVTSHGTPVSFAHAGADMSLPAATFEAAKTALAELPAGGGYVHEAKVYDECAHGFAVRTRPGNQKEVEAADGALTQAVEWFDKWL